VPLCRRRKRLCDNPDTFQLPPVPPHRGAARDRHGREAGCDGRDGNARRAGLMRTAKSCGPDIPTLMSSWRRCFRIAPATVATKPGHRGEREGNRKTTRAGNAGKTGVTVVTMLACSSHVAREAAGANGARHSLRPLILSRDAFFAEPGRVIASRECEVTSSIPGSLASLAPRDDGAWIVSLLFAPREAVRLFDN
jgi:hypothetical protein